MSMGVSNVQPFPLLKRDPRRDRLRIVRIRGESVEMCGDAREMVGGGLLPRFQGGQRLGPGGRGINGFGSLWG